MGHRKSCDETFNGVQSEPLRTRLQCFHQAVPRAGISKHELEFISQFTLRRLSDSLQRTVSRIASSNRARKEFGDGAELRQALATTASHRSSQATVTGGEPGAGRRA